MNIISLQIEIFILIFVGYVLSKFQVIDIRLRKGLSNLVLKVVLPASIIQSLFVVI
ncbi:AEC family transporter [Ileibacterium valens]|uniref:AEC family transporter n=1 Tax=Ileibacterium valens TaxID=1862668 RepID=UPI002355D1E8|nr:AEC family transporter [Ileibacterium valens]